MKSTGRSAIALLVLVVAAAGAYWLSRHRDSSPYTIQHAPEPTWTLVTSDGTDPWVVGVEPPRAMISSLTNEVSRRAGRTLVTPPHPAVPLVLRAEFDESLQGAFGVDSIHRLAADAGLDTAGAFQPVCLAHQTVEGEHGSADLYFVPFASAGFNQLRINLMPEHPEQAGIGIYDPSVLSPVLILAATENGFDRWWPLRVDPARDCEAPIASQ